MSDSLPVVHGGVGGCETLIVCPDTGEMVALGEASDHALAHAAQKLAEHDAEILTFKRSLAYEMRVRHGVGTAQAGGYAFKVTQSQSWPKGATDTALDALVAGGTITQADADRCRPSKPKPDGTQLKALVGRLTLTDPVAAKRLADACTLSPPSWCDVRAIAVDVTAEATVKPLPIVRTR